MGFFILAALVLQKFIDQKTAQQLAPVAEAIANLCTLLYYQADTGSVAEDEFQDALARIRQAVASLTTQPSTAKAAKAAFCFLV